MAAVLEIDSDIEEVVCKSAFDVELEKQLSTEIYPGGDEDQERLPREAEPYPPLPDPSNGTSGSSAAQLRHQAEKEAAAALAENDLQRAVDAYTLAMETGGATAMMLANRGALLLKQRRPCAAIRDCTAALKINSSMVKAYRIRGIAHRKLGHWLKGHDDISQAQALKFDAEAVEILTFLKSKCRKVGAKVERKAKRSPAKESPVREGRPNSDLSGKAKAPPQQLRPVAPPVQPTEVLNDLTKGQLVILSGLQNAAHLNGKRGVVERCDPRPASKGRWEIEVRLDGGRLEIKSLKRENIKPLSKTDRAACRAWAAAEKRHKEERLRFQESEEHAKISKCLEAKISRLPLGTAARELLGKLQPQHALVIVDKAGVSNVANINEFVASEAKLLLDGSGSDKEGPEAKRQRN